MLLSVITVLPSLPQCDGNITAGSVVEFSARSAAALRCAFACYFSNIIYSYIV